MQSFIIKTGSIIELLVRLNSVNVAARDAARNFLATAPTESDDPVDLGGLGSSAEMRFAVPRWLVNSLASESVVFTDSCSKRWVRNDELSGDYQLELAL